MGKKSEAADPPDVVGAAKEEGEQAKELANQETIANRPDQYNPWGSTTWGMQQVYDPVSGGMVNKWTQTDSLNPQLQAALDAQFGQNADRSQWAQQLFSQYMQGYEPMDFSQFGDVIQPESAGSVPQYQGSGQFQSGANQMGEFTYDDVSGLGNFGFDQTTNPFDYDYAAQRQSAEDAMYQSATNRLDPQFEKQQQALETKLRNQGLSPGDRAWDAAMQNFGTTRNDAYEQARLGATAAGRDEANMLYNQQLGAYQTNLGQQNQMYNQALQSFQQNQSLQDQAFQQGLGAFGQNLATQGQNFGQDLASWQQNYNQGLNDWQAQSQGQQQQYDQNMQSAEMANQLRQQQMQEALMAQGYPLDMIERIMGGTIDLTGGTPSGGVESEGA